MSPSYATATQWEGWLGKQRWWGDYSKHKIKVEMTRLSAQFRTSWGPTFQLKVFSGRQTGRHVWLGIRRWNWDQFIVSWQSAVSLWRGDREALNFPASFCDPSYLLLWACTPALGELRSSGCAFSRMLASVWQSGQIHALGMTLVCLEAVLVKKRFYNKLLPALENRAMHETVQGIELPWSPRFRSIWTKGKVPWRVRNIPLFCAVFLQAPGVLPHWFCCKSA